MTDLSYDYSFEDKLNAVVDGRVRSFEKAGITAFPELERILMTCLKGNREKRYQTFESLYAALDEAESQLNE